MKLNSEIRIFDDWTVTKVQSNFAAFKIRCTLKLFIAFKAAHFCCLNLGETQTSSKQL